MAFSGTVAILNTVKRGGNGDVGAAVMRVFGASSIEECLEVYARLGAAERTSIDDAVGRAAAKGGVAFLAEVEDEALRVAGAGGADSAELRGSAAGQERGGRSWVDDDPELSRLAEMDAASVASAEGDRFHGRVSETFAIRRELVSIGRSYSVEDAAGERCFRVAGRVRFARTFDVRDASGNVLYTVREKLLAGRPTFIISRDDAEFATLVKVDSAPAETFEVTFASGGTLRAEGLLWREEGVQITREGVCVAVIRREQGVLREAFRLQTAAGSDRALMVAVTMAIVETDSSRGND